MSDVDVNENLGGDGAARDIGTNPIEYTETITTRFGERLQASCWGILFGIILFIGSFPFLYWNEGRAVDRYEALNEAEGETITVSGLNIDPLNDGKVLHFSVNITNGDDAPLVDPIFGVSSSSDSLILHRDTEMYQWVEKVSTTSKKNVGGSKTTTKNYSYVKEWKNHLINSGSFKKQSNQHVNPSYMEFESTKIIANPIRIGAYDLPSSLVGRLTWDRPLRDVTMNDISNVELRNRAVQSGGQFYFAANTKVSSGTATQSQSQNISPPPPSVSPISITPPVENSVATRPPLPNPTTSQPTNIPTQNPTTLKPTPLPTSSRPVLGPTAGSAGCTDTPNYLDTWGGSCADYELPGNEAWCAGYGNTGEQGKTPNENCCVCKALLSGDDDDEEEIVLGGLRGRRVQAQVVMEEVPGYTYSGYGWCRGANVEDGYHNVHQVYTQTVTECGSFCNKFPVVNKLRGFTWTDGGGIEKHCYCMFDAGTDVQSLAKEYGGAREHWGTMTPAKHSDQGTAVGPIQNVFDGKRGYDAYCYSLDAAGSSVTFDAGSAATSCPYDQCINRCSARYGETDADGDYLPYVSYCSKGCAEMDDGKLIDKTKFCSVDETVRYSSCLSSCKGASSSELNQDACRYGCEFWIAPAQIPQSSDITTQSTQSSDITTSSGPQIGDQRVSFSEVPASVITIVGVQNGNTISAFVSETGEGGEILLFKQGSYSSVEMYDEAEASNAAATWILRFVGFIAMALGLYLIFRPIEVFADIVPCVGSIIGCGIIFMSVLLAGILSTITISIAWLAAQPKIGAIVLACLLVVVGSCAFGFKKIKGKQNSENHDDGDIKLETNKDGELEVVASAVPTVEAIPEQEITVDSVSVPERANEPPTPYVP